MKKFVYVVNGIELEDTKAFGLAGAKATELYLANGMVFLAMNDKFNENVKVFLGGDIMKQTVIVIYNVFLNKYVIRVKEEYNNGRTMTVQRDGKTYKETVEAIKQVVNIDDDATIIYKVNDNGKWYTSDRKYLLFKYDDRL